MVVFVVDVVGQCWSGEKVLTTLVAVEVFGALVDEHVRVEAVLSFKSFSTLIANKVLLVAVPQHVVAHVHFAKHLVTDFTFFLDMCANYSMRCEFMFI